MHPNVQAAMDALHPAFERLMACSPYRKGTRLPERGVFLFTEDGNHLYASRPNRLWVRRAEHCRPSSTFDQASFVMLIARRHTGLYGSDVDKFSWTGPATMPSSWRNA
ncbi:hypothetical protein Q8W71_30855 [Methylobacterium sp. NEAU 140]|uniref:hypothetical protein n=1 Tax=Methylobacterium sp. NEAU 140 TaxID=3064945 RepID=UPI0027363C3E|nr:hypothetical protein [Methylobacterium sp. NEAU 140]MDP4026992.1 hypothetical protein [Methylobacterium sp. NEAU 140]